MCFVLTSKSSENVSSRLPKNIILAQNMSGDKNTTLFWGNEDEKSYFDSEGVIRVSLFSEHTLQPSKLEVTQTRSIERRLNKVKQTEKLQYLGPSRRASGRQSAQGSAEAEKNRSTFVFTCVSTEALQRRLGDRLYCARCAATSSSAAMEQCRNGRRSY